MKRVAIIAATLILTACAIAPRQDSYSLIDPSGVDMTRYQADYDACARLADQTSVGANTAAGAGAGALIGAVLGAAICGRSCANSGAAFGAGYGGTVGALNGVHEQQNALRACLAGRGYRVIR